MYFVTGIYRIYSKVYTDSPSIYQKVYTASRSIYPKVYTLSVQMAFWCNYLGVPNHKKQHKTQPMVILLGHFSVEFT